MGKKNKKRSPPRPVTLVPQKGMWLGQSPGKLGRESSLNDFWAGLGFF